MSTEPFGTVKSHCCDISSTTFCFAARACARACLVASFIVLAHQVFVIQFMPPLYRWHLAFQALLCLITFLITSPIIYYYSIIDLSYQVISLEALLLSGTYYQVFNLAYIKVRLYLVPTTIPITARSKPPIEVNLLENIQEHTVKVTLYLLYKYLLLLVK